MSTLGALLADATPPPASTDVRAYLETLTTLPKDATTVERAALAGARADRLGYAFAGGYHAALTRLVPGVGRACLCATEAGGGHPRAMLTRLAPREDGEPGFTLTGTKTFATLARAAEALLVVASVGEHGGKNELRLVRLPADRAHVEYTDLPETPFAPEIPHAAVRFAGVRVEPADVLLGDGYDRYLKPFRTIEDVHVLAAAIGYVVRTGLAYGFGRVTIEELFAHLAALMTLGEADPLDRGVHVALAGVLGGVRTTLADGVSHWAGAPDEVQRRWLRDAPLLAVADRVRAARTEAAWVPRARRS